MKQATINIIRCILKQEECMTPPMIRRFIDWIQLSEPFSLFGGEASP